VVKTTGDTTLMLTAQTHTMQ